MGSKKWQGKFWSAFDERASEPHRVSAGGINKAKAEAILRLLENGDAASQAELNGLAAQYRLATPQNDAAAVNTRMRKLAEGVLQMYASGRYVDDEQTHPAVRQPSGPSM